MLGNKVHIYKVGNNKLIECILIGVKINNIEKVSFINKRENYLLVNINNKKINIYKINKNKIEQGIDKNYLKDAQCVCGKYNDDDIINGRIKLDNNYSFFGFFWENKNTDIKDSHASISIPNIIFSDSFLLFNKSFVIIDKKGYFYIYFFIKEKIDELPPYKTCKWI